MLPGFGVGFGQMVERVEGVQATAAAHPTLTGEQLFRGKPENGLATRAASQHLEWIKFVQTENNKSSPVLRTVFVCL